MRQFGLNYSTEYPDQQCFIVCRLFTAKQCTVYLHTGSDDTISIYLNYKPVYCSNSVRPLRTFDEVTELSLDAGSNTVLVSVGNHGGAWSFNAHLTRTREEATIVALSSPLGFLRNRVVLETTQVQLRASNFPASTSVPAIFRHLPSGHSTKSFLRTESTSPLPLEKGLSKVVLNYGGRSFNDWCFLGAPDDALDLLDEAIASKRYNDSIDHLCAIRLRLAELIKKQDFTEQRESWELKFIHYVKELYSTLHGRSGDLSDDPRLELNTFRSKIDGALQIAQTFIPAGTPPDGGYPCVIIPPPAIENSRPYISSSLIADLGTAKELATEADKLGIALIWPGYRNSPYGHPAEFVQMDEAIDALAARTHIDESRLFIVGTCSSGMVAAMAVERRPERFLAIGLVNPVLHRLVNNLNDPLELTSNPQYKQWLLATDPIINLNKWGRTHLWIVQNGNDPKHGPASHTHDFAEEASRFSSVRLKLDESNDPYPELSHVIWAKTFFPWFKSIAGQRSDAAQQQSPAKNFEEFFARPFVLIHPTGGGFSERAWADACCSRFQSQWMKLGYGPCVQQDDTAVTSADVVTSQLVLIGSPTQNCAWKMIAPETAAAYQSQRRHILHGKTALQLLLPPVSNGESVVVIDCDQKNSTLPIVFATVDDGWDTVRVTEVNRDGSISIKHTAD